MQVPDYWLYSIGLPVGTNSIQMGPRLNWTSFLESAKTNLVRIAGVALDQVMGKALPS